MAPGGGAREGDTQGGALGCAAGAAARRAGRFHVQQRRSWGAAALLVPLASRGADAAGQGRRHGVDDEMAMTHEKEDSTMKRTTS